MKAEDLCVGDIVLVDLSPAKPYLTFYRQYAPWEDTQKRLDAGTLVFVDRGPVATAKFLTQRKQYEDRAIKAFRALRVNGMTAGGMPVKKYLDELDQPVKGYTEINIKVTKPLFPSNEIVHQEPAPARTHDQDADYNQEMAVAFAPIEAKGRAAVQRKLREWPYINGKPARLCHKVQDDKQNGGQVMNFFFAEQT